PGSAAPDRFPPRQTRCRGSPSAPPAPRPAPAVLSLRCSSCFCSSVPRRQELRRPGRPACATSLDHHGIPVDPQSLSVTTIGDRSRMAKTRQTAPSGRHLSLAQPPYGDNAPQPIRTLRDWLDRLAARDRLTVLRPGVDLRFELAAIAKRLDRRRPPPFPPPGRQPNPAASGPVPDPQWSAAA